jgi:hypothetical protein
LIFVKRRDEMQMEDKIEEISKRLDALEHEYHSDKKVVNPNVAKAGGLQSQDAHRNL